MALNCYVLLSLFVRSPSGIPGVPTGDEPSLWLTVQPCVASSDLSAWIDAMPSDTVAGALAYSILDKDVACAGDLVPVLLPPDLSIRVKRLSAVAFEDLVNDRTWPRIVSAGTFMADNVRSEKLSTLTAPIHGSYAGAVKDQILATWVAMAGDKAARLQSMQGWLTLGFWFGTSRVIRPSSVDTGPTSSLFDAVRRPSDGDALPSLDSRRVSHLSMCGHMLRLDKGIQFADLAKLTGLEVTLERADGTVVLLPMPEEEKGFLSQFFHSIDPASVPPSAASLLEPTVLSDISRRVYVTHQRNRLLPSTLTFGSAGADSHWLFGVGASSQSSIGDVRLQSAHLDRIAVFYQRQNQDDYASKPHAGGTFRFHEAIRCRLQPYRDATADAAGAQLWQLVPVEQDKLQFVARFGSRAAAKDTHWPVESTLHLPSGARVELGGHFLEESYVGSFLLPWDDTDSLNDSLIPDPSASLPTVLFQAIGLKPPSVGGKSARTVDVNLVNRVGSDGSPSYEVKANFRTDSMSPEGPRGPLWEGIPAGLASFAFTAIEFVHPELSSDLVSRLLVTYTQDVDYRFELAQSAQHLEAVLQVVHPTVDVSCPAPPADASLLGELKRECTGYRSVRATLQVCSPGANVVTRALHPWSSKPSVNHDTHDGRDRHSFVVRERLDLYSAPAGFASEPSFLPREFFGRAYAEVGVPRSIQFDLEHASGHAVAVASCAAASVHDAPPHLPTGMRSQDEGGPAFLTIALLNGHAKLMFDLSFLKRETWKAMAPDSSKQDDKAFAGWSLAWRSVADMAYADSMWLRGLFRTFDFAGSIAAAQGVTAHADSLLHSLLPVQTLENPGQRWRVPDSLRQAALSWLNGTTLPPSFSVDVPLGGTAGDPSACDVVEFWFEIDRAKAGLPDLKEPLFAVLRSGSVEGKSAFDANGELFDEVDPARLSDVTNSFQLHLQHVAGTFDGRLGVLNGWRAIAPADDARTAARDLRNLLQSQRSDQDDPSMADLRAKEWIVPKPIVAKSTAVTATVIPLCFRPLASRYAGSFGATAVTRYLSALDMLINVDQGEWSTSLKTPSDWRGWFASMQTACADVVQIVKTVQSLLFPSFDSEAVAADLDPQVQKFLSMYQSAAGGFQGLRHELQKELLSAPRLFSESRAFLVTRLSAPDRLPRSFHAVTSERSPQATSPAGGTQRAQLEHSRLTIKDVVLGDAGANALVFVEALAARKYHGQFGVQLQAFSIQDFVGPASASTRVPSLTLDGPHVGLKGNGGAVSTIDLPSREPITQPSHVYTAVVPDMLQRNWANHFVRSNGTRGLSLLGLLNKQKLLRAAGSEPELFLRAASADFMRSGLQDRRVAAAVFNLNSDEANEFINDSFQLFRSPARSLPAASTAPAVNVPGIFAELQSAVALDKIVDLRKVIDPTVSATLVDALKLAPPKAVVGPVDGVSGFEIEVDESGVLPSIVGAPSDVGIFLFRTGDIEPGTARHVLVVTAEANVWQTFSWSLIQTRNLRFPDRQVAPAKQLGFNPALSLASSPVGDSAGLQLRLAVTFDKRQPDKKQRKFTPAQLVDQLLVQSKAIAGDDNASTWKTQDLSILVSAVQKVTMPVLGSPIGGSGVELSHGKFPLASLRWPAGTPGSTDPLTLDPERHEFTVDFTWTAPTNVEVFRIQGVPLRIND